LAAQAGRQRDLVIAYTGAVAGRRSRRSGLLGEDRRDVGLLAITSADRLNAGWTGGRAAATGGNHQHSAISSAAAAELPRDCGIVTVLDGHPATLAWLGSVCGHKQEALGVEHFGQTGTIGRSLSPFRHRRECDRRRGGGAERRARAASEDGGVGLLTSPRLRGEVAASSRRVRGMARPHHIRIIRGSEFVRLVR
jgi:hypothetical protein